MKRCDSHRHTEDTEGPVWSELPQGTDAAGARQRQDPIPPPGLWGRTRHQHTCCLSGLGLMLTLYVLRSHSCSTPPSSLLLLCLYLLEEGAGCCTTPTAPRGRQQNWPGLRLLRGFQAALAVPTVHPSPLPDGLPSSIRWEDSGPMQAA